jgi:DNA polymerase III subunit chi
VARVDFHSQVGDKLSYTCRLVRKIFSLADGQAPLKNIVLIGSPDDLQQLDQLLWTFSPDDFIPHARIDDEAAMVTPLLLTTTFSAEQCAALPHADVCIHLGQEFLNDIEWITNRFERVIEVVSTEEKDLLAGRLRYKRYREMGLELVNHDQKGAA